MTKASDREQETYRKLAWDVVSLDLNNRIRVQCVEMPYRSHSPSDFETDLASYFLAAANAGLIKIVHRGRT